MLSGELYDASAPELVAERARAREFLVQFNISAAPVAERQAILVGLLGLTAGFYIEPPFYCDYGYNIELGPNFYANFNCVLLDPAPIKIGQNVLLGPGVHIYTATHPLAAQERRSGLKAAYPVEIGDDVWIGGGAIICPGVKIGAGSAIGAGSVVTRAIPAGVLALGNPARVVRSL